MKKIHLIISICISLFTLSSCSDFLDKEPNELSTGLYYNNDIEAEEGINAAYAIFYNFFQNHVGFETDCLSDDLIKGHGTDFSIYNSFNTGELLANNGAITSLYSDYYQGIFRANFTIDNVKDNSKISEAKRNQVLGEAYFLRAWFYYQLVQRFGGVALFTSTKNMSSEPARETAETIYNQMEEDLISAGSLLEYAAQSTLGRPNKGTALCVLGLVQLSQNKFHECYTTLKPIINNEGNHYNYGLIQDLSKMFQLNNNNGVESVFEIQSRQGAPIGFTMAYNHWVRPRGMAVHGGLGFAMPTQSLYNEFENGDYRREATILKDGDFIAEELIDNNGSEIRYKASWAPETGMNNAKYVKWVNVGDFQERLGQNKKLVRFAEVLLAFAEAAYKDNHSDEAWDALKTVRKRAFKVENPPVYSNDFMIALRHEKRVELATENRRYFDLVRWGLAETILTSDCKKHINYNLPYVYNKQAKGLYPIPQSELDINKNPNFKQNSGY